MTSHLILIVYQSCKFKGDMSAKKASMEGGDEELGGVEEVSKVTEIWPRDYGGTEAA